MASTQKGKEASKLSEIKLADGTKIPMGTIPGLSEEQVRIMQEYMLNNPEMAKGAKQAAEQLAKNPAMARKLMNMPISQEKMGGDDQAIMFAELREDPELKHVFEDIQKNGPQAMAKYWDDRELMSKIHYKMEAMKVDGEKPAQKKEVEAKDLAQAAKLGILDAVKKFLDDGADINQKDARGIAPIQLAVGLNRITVVKELMDRGADLNVTDNNKNTLLHYAAGYGRTDLVQILLSAGLAVDAKNSNKQTPQDVAKQNREVHIVELLKKHVSGGSKAASKSDEEQAIQQLKELDVASK